MLAARVARVAAGPERGAQSRLVLVSVAIQSIEQAAFLAPEQKRDIFYNNAARFLRLSEAEIASHTGR